jgi:hypothetical protein
MEASENRSHSREFRPSPHMFRPKDVREVLSEHLFMAIIAVFPYFVNHREGDLTIEWIWKSSFLWKQHALAIYCIYWLCLLLFKINGVHYPAFFGIADETYSKGDTVELIDSMERCISSSLPLSSKGGFGLRQAYRLPLEIIHPPPLIRSALR